MKNLFDKPDCYDCIHCGACSDAGDSGFSCLKEDASKCKHFKNKADFVEVIRCGKCIHGDVSCHAKTKDGEETIACYCTIKNKVTDVDYYCPNGERRDT